MLSNETVVVVSPLIALMQDQVAQLTQMGIPSAVLNSSLTKPKQAQVIDARQRRESYRLLYLSPERLARADTSHGCGACRFRSSPSTKRIASRNGATNSGPNTAS